MDTDTITRMLRRLFALEINGWLSVFFLAQGHVPDLLVIGGVIVLLIYIPTSRIPAWQISTDQWCLRAY